MLTAHLNYYYWDHLGRLYYRSDKGLRILIAVFSSSAVAAWAVGELYPSIWKTLTGITAVAAVVQPLLDLSKKIAEISDLRRVWGELRVNWEELWNTEAWDDLPDVIESVNKLNRDVVKVSELEQHLPRRKRLIKKCERRVRQYHSVESKGEITDAETDVHARREATT